LELLALDGTIIATEGPLHLRVTLQPPHTVRCNYHVRVSTVPVPGIPIVRINVLYPLVIRPGFQKPESSSTGFSPLHGP
jgi:hypothetical protein